ncbi:hypothetical protein M2150_001799 [Lachnospiraceae bacterium PM6-15]|uniref:plasmid mobilization protein n=1 Tax=Ohessyouella blattaphilus TaxID=2949333 RepID=UPI003E2FF5B1
MRKRKVQILFRLNEKEAEVFGKKIKRSGLTREVYLRQLIKGVVPRDAPPPDYYSMMRELRSIGTNLNQIAQKANVLNVVDVKRYDEVVRHFEATIKAITEAVILPRAMTEAEKDLLEGGDKRPWSEVLMDTYRGDKK